VPVQTRWWWNKAPVIGESRHFPSGALRDRIRAEVEPALGSWPWVVLAPVCAAALATFVAIRFVPAAHVHDNSVDGPPWLLSLGLAVFGAVIGIFLVGGGLWVWLWRRYLKHGDPRFTAGATHPHADRFPLGLTYSGDRAFDAGTLGSYQAFLKHPSGQVTEHGELNGARLQGPTLFLYFFNALPTGRYEARWYLTPPGARRQEICRAVLIDPVITHPTIRPGKFIPKRFVPPPWGPDSGQMRASRHLTDAPTSGSVGGLNRTWTALVSPGCRIPRRAEPSARLPSRRGGAEVKPGARATSRVSASSRSGSGPGGGKRLGTARAPARATEFVLIAVLTC
jgi:hypothetical protein